jgi:RNA polymerase sigma-70 factor (ECF subfamily)
VGVSTILYEKVLLDKLKAGDQSAFTTIFSTYYRDLVIFANSFTKQIEVSEEIVQEVFVNFWDSRNQIFIKTSLKSYLLKTVQNRCIDWLRHLKIRDKYSGMVLDNAILMENDTENYIFHSELEKDLYKALGELPAELSKTFKMSRIDGIKYQEIAEELGVSVRTIEVRVAKVLTLLHEKLRDYLIITVILYQFFIT